MLALTAGKGLNLGYYHEDGLSYAFLASGIAHTGCAAFVLKAINWYSGGWNNFACGSVWVRNLVSDIKGGT
jgi:hypothetical protein